QLFVPDCVANGRSSSKLDVPRDAQVESCSVGEFLDRHIDLVFQLTPTQFDRLGREAQPAGYGALHDLTSETATAIQPYLHGEGWYRVQRPHVNAVRVVVLDATTRRMIVAVSE